MSNEIVAIPSESEVGTIFKLAKELIPTGFLPVALNTPGKVAAVVLTGKELGVPPMESLRGINVINGKPSIAPELMLRLAYERVPGFRLSVLESTDTLCKVEVERSGNRPWVHTFTMEDAGKLGLAGKDNWKKQPATMLRWRCIAAALRAYAPDATRKLLTHEEAESIQETDGRVEKDSSLARLEQVAPVPLPSLKQVEARVVDPQSTGDSPIVGAPPMPRASRFDLNSLLVAFNKFQITRDTLELQMGKSLDNLSDEEITGLRNAWKLLCEGKTSNEAFADVPNALSNPATTQEIDPRTYPKISEAQFRRLMAMAKEASHDKEMLNIRIKKDFNLDHVHDLTQSQYDQVCKFLESVVDSRPKQSVMQEELF